MRSVQDFLIDERHEVWDIPISRKSFKMLHSVTKDMNISRYTIFAYVREIYDVTCPSSLSLLVGKKSDKNDKNILTLTNKEPFSLKAIQLIKLTEFIGRSKTETDWKDATKQRFYVAVAKHLLDKNLCNDHIEIFHTGKYIVVSSLENSSASYLNTTYKDEKNLETFTHILDQNYDNIFCVRNREF